jgi:hypothetical protein
MSLSTKTRSDWAVEIGRVLAAYGVIIIHSPMGHGATVSTHAGQFISYWGFAVPFFLMAAYYYSWQATKTRSVFNMLRGRFVRLALPFLAWTVIYLAVRCCLYFAKNDLNAVARVIGDPVGVFIFGQAAVHLYFVPLMGAGLMWFLWFSNDPPRSARWLVAGLVFSTVISWLLVQSGNNFGAGRDGFGNFKNSHGGAAFPLLRVPFAIVACLIQTAPYFFAAGLLNRIRTLRPLWHSSWAGGAGLIFGVLLMHFREIIPFAESFAGMVVFAGLLLQTPIQRTNHLIPLMGSLSAGCFFCHHLVIECFQLIIERSTPEYAHATPLWLIFTMTSLTGVVSFTVAFVLVRFGKMGRILAAV